MFQFSSIILIELSFNAFPQNIVSSEATEINKKWSLPSKCQHPNEVDTAAASVLRTKSFEQKVILETRDSYSKLTSFEESVLPESHSPGYNKENSWPCGRWCDGENINLK